MDEYEYVQFGAGSVAHLAKGGSGTTLCGKTDAVRASIPKVRKCRPCESRAAALANVAPSGGPGDSVLLGSVADLVRNAAQFAALRLERHTGDSPDMLAAEVESVVTDGDLRELCEFAGSRAEALRRLADTIREALPPLGKRLPTVMIPLAWNARSPEQVSSAAQMSFDAIDFAMAASFLARAASLETSCRRCAHSIVWDWCRGEWTHRGRGGDSEDSALLCRSGRDRAAPSDLSWWRDAFSLPEDQEDHGSTVARSSFVAQVLGRHRGVLERYGVDVDGFCTDLSFHELSGSLSTVEPLLDRLFDAAHSAWWSSKFSDDGDRTPAEVADHDALSAFRDAVMCAAVGGAVCVRCDGRIQRRSWDGAWVHSKLQSRSCPRRTTWSISERNAEPAESWWMSSFPLPQ